MRVLYWLFNIYALGLVAYMILSWIHAPSLDSAQVWLGQFYLPFLMPLRKVIKPITVGGGVIDLAPGVLLMAIIVARQVAVHPLRLVYWVFNIYALGLIAYAVLAWIRMPGIDGVQQWLERLYVPFLMPLQKTMKPITVGGTAIDPTPGVLLIGIILVRQVVVYLLTGIP